MDTVEVQSNYVRVIAKDDENGFSVELPFGQGLLRTPGGHIVESENIRLLTHMVREFEEHPILHVREGIIEQPRPLSAYLLHATQLEDNSGDHTAILTKILEHDPILHPSAGPEWTDQLRSWEPIDSFLRSLGVELHPRGWYSVDEAGKDGSRWQALVAALARRWKRLAAPALSVVKNIHHLCDGHTIAGTALASGAISAVEFGQAVLCTSPAHYAFGDFEGDESPQEMHIKVFRELRDFARVCEDFLRFFPPQSVILLMADGENERLEYKSTLRWDLRQNKYNDALTHSCLKTIAAFINTTGGTLLIGVADDGTAVGIQEDRFENEDKFLLHLYNKIKSTMGQDAGALVKANFDTLDGKLVCVVKCHPSESAPIYLRPSKGPDEEFFIRTGPATEKLSPSALVKYIEQRFS